jgi:hypothetical protein
MTIVPLMLMIMIPFASASEAAADLSGTWAISGDVQGNAVNLDCTITQGADTTLTGRCQVNGGEMADITGAVKDASIQFSFTVSGYTLNYSGKVDGETVSGAIEVAGATGTFAGTRAKA